MLVWYSQEARAYALFILLGALSLLAFVRAVETRGTAPVARWAVVSALVVATHYFGIFLVAAEAAFLLYRRPCRTVVIATAGFAAAAVALLPLAAYQATHASSSWIRPSTSIFASRETVAQLLVPSGRASGQAQVYPKAPLRGGRSRPRRARAAACAAVALRRGRQRRGVVMSLFSGSRSRRSTVVVSLASAALVGGRGDVLLFRNVLCAWLPLQIVVAAALAAPRAGRVGLAAAAALMAASLGVLVANATTAHLQRDDWRLVARATEARPRDRPARRPREIAGLSTAPARLAPPSSVASLREIDVLRAPGGCRPSARQCVPCRRRDSNGVKQRTLQNWVLTRFRASNRSRCRRRS